MSSLERTFQEARQRGRAALISYLPVGVPTVADTLDLAQAADGAGTDIFELGVPFTDALADGTVVREASRLALRNGITVRTCLEVVQELRSRGVTKPLVMMGCLNPFCAYGLERLARDAGRAGVDGFLVPDLPFDDAAPWRALLDDNDMTNVPFVAPGTGDERIRAIAAEARAFLYCYAHGGVTGARQEVAPDLQAFLARIRQVTALPLAVGYGISTPAQAQLVAQWADGVVVGTAFVEILLRAPAHRLCAELADAVHQMAAATVRSADTELTGTSHARPN